MKDKRSRVLYVKGQEVKTSVEGVSKLLATVTRCVYGSTEASGNVINVTTNPMSCTLLCSALR